MEVNELLIPIIAGGICLAISIYGLAVAKDRFFALGGLFLYSFIPIIHRVGLLLEDPQDYFSFATIVIFIVFLIVVLSLIMIITMIIIILITIIILIISITMSTY